MPDAFFVHLGRHFMKTAYIPWPSGLFHNVRGVISKTEIPEFTKNVIKKVESKLKKKIYREIIDTE